jgi:prepilin-type N-terminal cleavage/methylation domain-containing protein/prepilin-type processing-associated H-X9-DG protein
MKCRGFTLIELLVVIAIIALLLAIIIPSLQTAKQKASGAVCMSRQRQLVIASTTYADDEDGDLIFGDTHYGDGAWVQPPQAEDGSASLETIEDRQRGCERGTLYAYLDSTDFYHCPGDRRISNPENDVTCAFRSFSVVAGLHSWWASEENDYTNVWRTDHISYEKISAVKATGQAMWFVEEAEMEQGYNQHSWAIYVATDQWYDPLAIYHNDSSTMGFVDGHVVSRKWRDSRTIERFELGIKGGGTSLPEPDNEDLQWLQAHYPYERLK